MNKPQQRKWINRRLLRGIIYIAAGLFVLVGNRFGWFSLDSNKQTKSEGFEQIHIDKQANSAQSSSSAGSVTTLRLEDPLERGENHKVTNNTKTVRTRTHSRSNDNQKIAQLFKNKKSDTWVTAFGHVGKVLPDDNKGSRHQRFLMDIGQQKWLLIAHNIDLAPKVPLRKGDQIVVHGEYEYNDKGGVIHWTHHDPRGYKDGGYIELNNKRYE